MNITDLQKDLLDAPVISASVNLGIKVVMLLTVVH